MENWEEQITSWIKEICPWSQIENYVQFHGRLPGKADPGKDWKVADSEWARQGKKESLKMLVFTKEHKYAIVANDKYLGCTMSFRKPRAGEDWTRGNDLPDGRFSRETWEAIKDAIIRNELVKVMKRPQYQKDEVKQ